MINLNLHVSWAILYFVIAAVLGVVLRSFQVVEFPVNYKFIVHTHSHIALLGWGYLALTTLLYKLYLSKSDAQKHYQKIFWFTQLTLAGMLLTFPFIGYQLFSIIFTTLFLFASYWFTWYFLKNVPVAYKTSCSFLCVKAALWYLVISSLGPWALGAIMNTLGAASIWYRLSIYFYLHFLYNGWMIMALIGILLYVLEAGNCLLPAKTGKLFLWSINLGIVLSFFLSALFAKPPIFLNILGGAGAIFQLTAFAVLTVALLKLWTKVRTIFTSFQLGLLRITAIMIALKMILQLVTAFRYFAHLAATILDFTIGYLHWTFLGVISIGLFLFLNYYGLMKLSWKSFVLYLLGFFITEALIFYRAVVAWCQFNLFRSYAELLVLGSLLIALSLGVMLGANIFGKKQEAPPSLKSSE